MIVGNLILNWGAKIWQEVIFYLYDNSMGTGSDVTTKIVYLTAV